MRKYAPICITMLFITLSCSENIPDIPNTLTLMELNGPVKSIKSVMYLPSDPLQGVTESDMYFPCDSVCFDLDGYATETYEFNPSGVPHLNTHHYDKYGRLIEDVYRSGNEVLKRVRYKYSGALKVEMEELDHKGHLRLNTVYEYEGDNIIRQSTYDHIPESAPSLLSRTSYAWNDGKVMESKLFDASNNTEITTEYRYDGPFTATVTSRNNTPGSAQTSITITKDHKDRIISSRDGDGMQETSIEYIVDKHDNWIIKKIYNGDSLVQQFEQQIVYY